MMEKKIESVIKKLFQQLEIQLEKITVTPSETGYQLDLSLSETDTGILIGYHGETINALQLIFNLLLYRQTGQWEKVVINIGDYRAKRREALIQLAEEAAKKVRFSQQPIALFNLNPFERRIVHEYFSQYQDLTTESQGEGQSRHLVVKLDLPKPETP